MRNMRRIKDFRGVSIRITDERMGHIMDHPEMVGMVAKVEETLKNPEQVIRSKTDDDAFLYYRFYKATNVGGKFLCVVVKEAATGAFLLTAYLTDRIKQGEMIWNKK